MKTQVPFDSIRGVCLGALGFLACACAVGTAQEMMDSMDKLTVAKSASRARVLDGAFSDALSSEKAALQFAENRFGKTHPSLAPVLTDLATIYRYMADYPAAEKELRWALALREKNLKSNDPLLAESLCQLGGLYGDWGRWKESLFYETRAHSILGNSNNKSDTLLSQVLNQLGRAQAGLGDTSAAVSSYKESLEVSEKAKTRDPVLVIEALKALSVLSAGNKQFSEAQSCLEKALETSKKNYASDSVEVGDALESLGDFFHARQQLEKAQPLYQSAIQNYKRFVGVYFGYPTLPYLLRLSKAYETVGDDKSSEDLLGKGLDSARVSYGKNHPQVAVFAWRLGQVQIRLGKTKSGREHLLECQTILQSLFPADYPFLRDVEARLKNN